MMAQFEERGERRCHPAQPLWSPPEEPAGCWRASGTHRWAPLLTPV